MPHGYVRKFFEHEAVKTLIYRVKITIKQLSVVHHNFELYIKSEDVGITNGRKYFLNCVGNISQELRENLFTETTNTAYTHEAESDILTGHKNHSPTSKKYTSK